MFGIIGLFFWSIHRRVVRARSNAVGEERSRLAREIHDSLLQGFGGIALQLHAASARLALPAAQQPLLDRVQTMIDQTLKQAREAVWDIRPLDDTGTDLATECEETGKRILATSATELRIGVHGRVRRLDPASHVECVRIVAEALTNVRKHAGAKLATVELAYWWRSLHLTITDDGEGFDSDGAQRRPGHWGLLGMRERASRIGARLTLRSEAGRGTTVSVRVPYRIGLFAKLTQHS